MGDRFLRGADLWCGRCGRFCGSLERTSRICTTGYARGVGKSWEQEIAAGLFHVRPETQMLDIAPNGDASGTTKRNNGTRERRG